MRRSPRFFRFVLCSLVLSTFSQASVSGPWRRYRSESLGFQVLYGDDWQVTPISNGVVFGMQLNPDPYLRLAVGRISNDHSDFAQSVDAQLALTRQAALRKTRCQLDGWPAIRVEGVTERGRVLDYYVDRGSYRYWIGFLADRPEQWNDYSQAIELIVENFHFL